MRFRVGIVGAGHISEFHLQGLQRLDCVEIVGLTDLDAELARSRSDQFGGLSVCSSLEDLLSQKPDVVHVLTPPASHAEIVLRCLESGCHVFAEKPLATTVADCDRIIEAAERSGKSVGVDHSLLLDPFTTKALVVVRSGKIGRVLNVECHRSQDWPPYVGGPLPPHYVDGGFPFRDIGIHSLYQIEAFLGEITDATWSFQKLGDDTNLAFDDWRATLKCNEGTAHVHLSWNGHPLQDVITVQGTEGTIRIDRFGMKVTTKKMSRLPEHPQRAANSLMEGLQTLVQVPVNLAKIVTKKIRRYHGLQAMVSDFYDALQHDRQPLATADDARRIGYWVEQVAADADRQKQRMVLDRQPRQLDAKTLVTGATGFIGGHLLDRLLQETDERIRVLCRRPTERLTSNPRLEIIIGDLGDPAAVNKAVAGVDRIYHVGGTVHGEPHDFYRGSVIGTKNIVDAALKHEVQQLIHISSLSVLHSAKFRKKDRITETWPLEPKAEARGHYTQTKLEAEKIVVDAAKQYKLPVVILRPAEVIGAGAPLLSPGVAKKVKNRLLILGDGTLSVPLVNVHDLVDAICIVCDKNVFDGSIYHIVDEQQLSQNELAAKYVAMTGDKLTITHVPRWFLSLAAIGIQCLCGVLKRPAPLSLYRLKSALSKRNFDCAKAHREIGWIPQRGLDQALQETLDALNIETADAEEESEHQVPCVC
ncbi:MAG: NAD-dependent epimerase/dehydratase family protein [Planctomycetales bacterium]|nr:NAD-dependent epimerase/dehydratase family protein [Planctomycetales bacterium]